MSANGDTDTVLRGVTHGAVDFLIKPVRTEELRNVWQHVLRKQTQQVRILVPCVPNTRGFGGRLGWQTQFFARSTAR